MTHTHSKPYYYLMGYDIAAQCYDAIYGAYSRAECIEEKAYVNNWEYKRLRVIKMQDTTPISDVIAIYSNK